ncbi:MAG: DUF1634 domain-containing protein [Deltaproteobacteria bacterium]
MAPETTEEATFEQVLTGSARKHIMTREEGATMVLPVTREASHEQLLYANILEKGMAIGLVLMLVTFFLYVFGIIHPTVPLDEVANYWNKPVEQYLEAVWTNFLPAWDQVPTGWSWLKLLSKGDFLNFLPIAMLSGVTIFCYLAIIPGLFSRGDKAMGFISMITSVILLLAASGMLAVGH